jgi:hypothetical protein
MGKRKSAAKALAKQVFRNMDVDFIALSSGDVVRDRHPHSVETLHLNVNFLQAFFKAFFLAAVPPPGLPFPARSGMVPEP